MATVAISDKRAKQEEDKQLSSYTPSQKVKRVIGRVLRDYGSAANVQNRPYEEFNDLRLIERQNVDQRAWNAYSEPRSEDPDEAWKANTVRPITRNKCISIAAHVTSALMYPKVFAQNKDDSEDKASAMVMEDLMEWSLEQSDYERKFLYSVISALYNPATILYTGYEEVYKVIKETNSTGWEYKEVLDEENSGFKIEIVPVDEFYIGNVYEHNIQKQPFILWRRVIDYSTAERKYGENEDFKKYVKPGLKIMYDENEDTFYEQYDDDLEYRLVEEVIYWNKNEDLMLTFCNGVLLDPIDNPNPRKDKKYPFAKSGYELIDEGRFFYYKSLADKLKDDQRVINILYNMVIDGSFLNLFPPSVVLGDEEIDTSVITPGTVTTFQADTKFETIKTDNNLAAGMNATTMVEKSIAESSTDPSLQGIASGGQQTAFEVSRLEQNARTMLGLFGKMISFLVKDLGELRMGDILQYMTVGEVSDLSVGANVLKFKSVLLENKLVDSQIKTRKIDFDLTVPEESRPESEALMEELAMLEEEEKTGQQIIKVNPKLFRELKYRVKIDADVVFKPRGQIEKAINLEAYDRLIRNPLADQQTVLKDFLLENYKPGESDKYIAKETKDVQATPGGRGKIMEQLTGVGKETVPQMPVDYTQE